MIDPVTEYVKKIAKAARERPLDVAQHPRLLKRFACMKEAKLAPFLFVDNSVIHIDMEVVREPLNKSRSLLR